MPSRKLANWLLSWSELFENTNIPHKYVVWSGLFVITSALQNRVWFDRGGRKIYPNLYVWVIGEPATSKGIPAEWAMRLLRKIPGLNIHSGELTKTWLLKTLQASAMGQQLSTNGSLQSITSPSLVIHSDELATTLPSNGALATELLNHLVSMYTVPDYHEYGTDKHGLMTIEKPLINWIVNTTPRWMHKAIPPHFSDTGLIARVNTIVAPFPKDPPSDFTVDPEKFDNLLKDLALIYLLDGEFRLDEEAADRRRQISAEQHLHRVRTDDEISRNLQGREDDHSLKIAMVLSAAVRSDLIITQKMYESANAMVNEARESSLYIYTSAAAPIKVQLKNAVLNRVARYKLLERVRLIKMLSNRYVADEIDLAIGQLCREDRIRVQVVEDPRTRKKLTILALKEEEDNNVFDTIDRRAQGQGTDEGVSLLSV